VTIPVEPTAAAAVFDDVHVARLVTSCVVPLDNVAVAVNCEVPPIVGAVPITAIDETVEVDVETVDGDVDESPHAAVTIAKSAAIAIAAMRRTFMFIILLKSSSRYGLFGAIAGSASRS
jgi:hypothetical protein